MLATWFAERLGRVLLAAAFVATSTFMWLLLVQIAADVAANLAGSARP